MTWTLLLVAMATVATHAFLIDDVFTNHINPKDKKEVRLNKKNQKVTLEVKTSLCCLPASKSLELKEEIIVELGDQVSLDVKIIRRSAL